MNLIRTAAVIAYDGFARHLHTLIPGGHALRAALARVVCDRVGPNVSIEPGVRLNRHLIAEEGAGLGAGSWFIGGAPIHLGRNLRMGPLCVFITNDHPVPGDFETFDDVKGLSIPIKVGNDVFIGARSIILPGVTIGDGAAVGAGSVVTKNIPAGAVAVGSPARVIRQRRVLEG